MRRVGEVLERLEVPLRVERHEARDHPAQGGRTVFEGACVDETTGDDVQGSRGRVVETVRWPSLRVTEEGGDGIARQLEGTQRVSTTYEGLTKGCLDLPTDRASYRVVLVRR